MTSVSMIEASKKVDFDGQEESKLQRVFYIYYFAQFSEFFIEALIDSDSKAYVI